MTLIKDPGVLSQLVWDLEANGLDDADTVWCISARAPDSHEPTLHFGPDEIEEGIKLLDRADELIGHNIIGYDLPLLEKLYGWKPRAHVVIRDTVVFSRLLRSDRPLPPGCPGNVKPHSLEAWGWRVGHGKVAHEDWSQYSPEMKVRCDEDVEVTRLTFFSLLKEARSTKGIDWADSLELEHDIAPIMAEQELNGCPLDLPLVWNLRFELKAKVDTIDDTLVHLIPEVPLPASKQWTWPSKQYLKNGSVSKQALKYYGEDFGKDREYRTDLIVRTAPINLGSDKQVKNFLMSIGWVPTEWNYKKDNKTKKYLRDEQGQKIKTSPKINLESLESCTWPDEHQDMGERIVERLMLAHRLSMVQGFIRDVRPDGNIGCAAVPAGTPTGRMTHRRVVNVPRNSSIYGKQLRSCFTTWPGYTRVGIDLASCQLRALAGEMRDEEFREQVINGSPHEYSAEMAGLDGDKKNSKKDKGKKLNYSVLFGAQPPKIAADLGLTLPDAKATIARFFKNLPKLDILMKRLAAEWKTNGCLVGPDGRAIWVRSEHMLLVYLMQAIESVVMKTFTVNLYKRSSYMNGQRKLVTTMHDENQWLVKDPLVPAFMTVAEDVIKNVNVQYNLWCPQAIDINLGSTWAECH